MDVHEALNLEVGQSQYLSKIFRRMSHKSKLQAQLQILAELGKGRESTHLPQSFIVDESVIVLSMT